MQAYFSLIPFLYLIVAAPYAVMGLYAWSRRPAVAVTPFAWMMVAIAGWSFLYALELFIPHLQIKIILTNLQYLGIVSIPLFLLGFALEYTGKRHLLSRRILALLWIIPLVIIIAAWTNPLHRLMWDSERVESFYGLTLLVVSMGPLFWLNIGYTYSLLLLGTLILIMEFIQRPGIYRFQVSLVILGLLSPWVGSVFYVFEISPIPFLDLSPLFFIPSSFALAWAITRYRLLDVIPLEHVNVLQNMRDGVIVLDPQRRILYINPIGEFLLGKKDADAIGQPFDEVSPEYARLLTPHLEGDEKQFEFATGSEAGSSVYEVTISLMQLVPQPGGGNHVIIFHDISIRKEAESLLNRREAIMKAISFIAEHFLREPLWEHAIPQALEKIGKATDVSRVYVAMNYTDAEGTLHSSLCYEWAAPGLTKRIDDLRMLHMPLQKVGLTRWEECLGKGETIQGVLKGLPEPEQRFLEPFHVMSLAVTPIFASRQWWGFIGFDECRYERDWSAIELEALHTTASIFGSAETRARTEQKLFRRQKTLQLLQEIVGAALRSSDLPAMTETLVAELGRLISADGCFLSLWDETLKQAIPLAAYGPNKGMYAALRPEPYERTLTSSALENGRTLIVEDVRNSPYVSKRIAALFSATSVLVLPMKAGETRLGAIMLSFDAPHRFVSDEIEIGEQAAGLIALALEKFQAVEHARRRAEEAERLRKAGAAVSETLETEEAIRRVLEQLAQVIPYDSASVQLLDGDELVIVGGHGWDDEKVVLGMRFPIPGDNPNTRVIESGQAVILTEADKVYPAFHNPPHSHIRSWLGVPLIARHRTIGLLAIDSSRPNHFTPDNVGSVIAFAYQVAIALENVRLFKETQTQAITDALTNLYNRRGLFELGEFEFSRARRIHRPFSAILMDIDHFKRVNDAHGHAAGDEVLRGLAERCRQGSRAVDLVGRYGGEEFLLLLPEASLDAAHQVGERLKQSITGKPFNYEGVELRISISAGVAEMKEADTLQSLIDRADAALYVAKHMGRNRVVAK